MKVKYIDKDHKYFDENGQELPSVTKILEVAGISDFSKIPPEILECAQLRGTYVHNACELYDVSKLNEKVLDPVLKAYLDGWKQFRRDFQPEILANEKIVSSEKYRFAGRIDRIMLINQKITLIDIKSGAIYPSATIQLAGYQLAWNEEYGKIYKIKDKFIVRLKNDGSYELSKKDFCSPNDITVFKSALALYYWRKNKGGL